MTINAVFFGIDGTLLNFSTQNISVRTRYALHHLKGQGIRFFAASGRSLEQVKQVLDFPLDDYITSNGSCCFSSDGMMLGRYPHRIFIT